MLSPMMRAYIVQQIAATFTETCLIEKPGASTDKIGGGKVKWLPVGSNIPCRVINNLRGQGVEVGDQPTDQWDMTLITFSDVELDIGYRVTFGSDVYFVKAVKGHLTDAVDKQCTISKKR